MVSKNLRYLSTVNSFENPTQDLSVLFFDTQTQESFVEGDLTEDEIGEVILNERKLFRGKYKQLPIGKPDTANTFYIERK
jgi:hypothetical protein